MQYIDVSCNDIGDAGLKHFASFISGKNSKALRVFECRKNNIQGTNLKGLFERIIKKGSFTYANFNSNDLCQEIGKEIYKALEETITIEEFQVNDNNQISYGIIENINNQCI
jgi:hypothetical protein